MSKRKTSLRTKQPRKNVGTKSRNVKYKMSSVSSKKSQYSSNPKSNRTRLMTTVRRSARKASAEKAFSNFPEKEKRHKEYIKEGYLQRGTNEKRTKTIAAATVNKSRRLRGETKTKSK